MSNKQTTAVSQLIEDLKETLKDCQPEFTIGIQHSILRASAYLPIERKQIEDAYNQGYREAEEDLTTPNKTDISEYENAEKYFTSTFITE